MRLRMREDNGGEGVETTEGVGTGICEDNGRGRLFVGNVAGDHPHPNLPPSRGKGFVGARGG